MSKDWKIQDPLGEMLKLVGVLDYLRGMWKIAGRRGYVYTGLSSRKREDLKSAWISVRTPLSRDECRRLVASEYATADQFRRLGSNTADVQMRVNPADVSALQLLAHVKALDTQANQLIEISAALDVAARIATLIGVDNLTQDLVPVPSRTVVSEWHGDGGWLTEGEGALAHGGWDDVRSRMRSGAQDGFRIELSGSTIRIAAALGTTSYVVEECLPRPDAPSVLNRVISAFNHEVRCEMEETLGVDEDAGQRRLFHIENTVAHGATVYVFDLWTQRLVQHDHMTDLLRKAIHDPESEAAHTLRNVAFLYHFECRVGRLGNPLG